MAHLKEKRAAEIQDAIRQVLYREWDPIGVCGAGPDDEYDSYIAGVYRILATSRSSKEALIEFLSRIESDLACLTSPETLRSVAEKLLGLNVKM